jgi:hypothetical protein
MEKLDFVHFVDEELYSKGLPRDAIAKSDIRELGTFPWDVWTGVIDATIGQRWAYDNHARSFKFGEFNILPTPGRYENLLVDRFIAAEFGMDLVANTANAVWSKEFDEQSLRMETSERLLRNEVTSLQTIDGPWHPMIKDLRNDRLLKSYRRRIGNVSGLADVSDVDNRVKELSSEFDQETRKIVAEHFDTMSLGKSAVMFLLGLIPAIGDFIGGAGLVRETVTKLSERKNKGWVGFLGQAKTKSLIRK